MKTIIVYLGSCPTCATPVTTQIDDMQFVGQDGELLDQIKIEGHCGTPGHNLLAGILTRNEFEAAPHGATI